jgi:hypothetical protein
MNHFVVMLYSFLLMKSYEPFSSSFLFSQKQMPLFFCPEFLTSNHSRSPPPAPWLGLAFQQLVAQIVREPI